MERKERFVHFSKAQLKHSGSMLEELSRYAEEAGKYNSSKTLKLRSDIGKIAGKAKTSYEAQCELVNRISFSAEESVVELIYDDLVSESRGLDRMRIKARDILKQIVAMEKG